MCRLRDYTEYCKKRFKEGYLLIVKELESTQAAVSSHLIWGLVSHRMLFISSQDVHTDRQHHGKYQIKSLDQITQEFTKTYGKSASTFISPLPGSIEAGVAGGQKPSETEKASVECVLSSNDTDDGFPLCFCCSSHLTVLGYSQARHSCLCENIGVSEHGECHIFCLFIGPSLLGHRRLKISVITQK